MKMESMIADSPRDGALFARCTGLIRLTLDAEIHDVVATDGTVIDDDIPGPQGNGIPLLDFKTRFLFAGSCCFWSRSIDFHRRGHDGAEMSGLC